jgi:hypothetical protein
MASMRSRALLGPGPPLYLRTRIRFGTLVDQVKRRASRETLEVPVTISFEDGSDLSCTSIDVSVDGAKLRIPTDFRPPGGVMRVTISGSRVRRRRARMVWLRDDELGIRFL